MARRLALCLAAWLGATGTASRAMDGAIDDRLLPERVLAALNTYRAQHGLAALVADPALTLLADEHSRTMAQRRVLSHEGFDARFARTGRRLCVENLARNHHQAAALLVAWQRSPDHHANLLAPAVRQAGIAAVDGYLALLACTPD